MQAIKLSSWIAIPGDNRGFGKLASSNSSPKPVAEERAGLSQACHFCKSRHLKCDGNHPCIQCELRRQECVFSTVSKKRGRRGRTGDEVAGKRKKIANEGNDGTPTPVIVASNEVVSPKLLSNEQQQILRIVQSGDLQQLEMEQVIDLIMAQQSKLDAKRKQLAESDTNGLFDLSDFSQDREYNVPTSDVEFEPDYANADTFATALHDCFSRRFGMYYPSGKAAVDLGQVREFVHKFNSAAEIRVLLQSDSIVELTEAFCYGVFLASGSGVMMRWRLGVEYAGRTELIGRALVRGQVGSNESCVAKLVGCLGYLNYFYMCAGLVASARSSILLRHFLFTAWSEMPSGGTVISMLYASLGGVANCTEGRLHWLHCSESLPSYLRSPITEVLHMLFTIGDIFCRADPLPDWTMLTATAGESEMVFRQKLYDKCQAIELEIDTAPHYVYARQREAQAVLHQILVGCRAVTSYWLGKHDEAIHFAITSIHNAPKVDQEIIAPWQLFANAYAIQICIILMQRELYTAGLELFKRQASLLPIGRKLLERLNDMVAHADAEVARFHLIGTMPALPFGSPNIPSHPSLGNGHVGSASGGGLGSGGAGTSSSSHLPSSSSLPNAPHMGNGTISTPAFTGTHLNGLHGGPTSALPHPASFAPGVPPPTALSAHHQFLAAAPQPSMLSTTILNPQDWANPDAVALGASLNGTQPSSSLPGRRTQLLGEPFTVRHIPSHPEQTFSMHPRFAAERTGSSANSDAFFSASALPASFTSSSLSEHH